MSNGRERVIATLSSLAHGQGGDPATWPNGDLAAYLGACARWLEDCDGYYALRGEGTPNDAWTLVADALMAARVYE